jgi:hypothetical protein
LPEPEAAAVANMLRQQNIEKPREIGPMRLALNLALNGGISGHFRAFSGIFFSPDINPKSIAA